MLIFIPALAVYFKSNCIIMVSPYGLDSFFAQKVNAFVRIRPIIYNISKANGLIMRNFKNPLKGFIVSMNISN